MVAPTHCFLRIWKQAHKVCRVSLIFTLSLHHLCSWDLRAATGCGLGSLLDLASDYYSELFCWLPGKNCQDALRNSSLRREVARTLLPAPTSILGTWNSPSMFLWVSVETQIVSTWVLLSFLIWAQGNGAFSLSSLSHAMASEQCREMETLMKVEIRGSEVAEIKNQISAQLGAQGVGKLHKVSIK